MLAERLTMFSAKLRAFENILLICIFAESVRFDGRVISKSSAPNYRF